MLCILSKKDYTQSKRLGKLLHVSILINFVLLKLARRMSDSVKISCKVKVRELEYWPKIRVYKTQWESKETTAFKRHHSYINIILLRLIKLIHIWYMALEGTSSHMQNTRLHLTEQNGKRHVVRLGKRNHWNSLRKQEYHKKSLSQSLTAASNPRR